jgi:predicted RNase H-like HicB family nuclease
VVVHMEPLPDRPDVTWWAESPDVPRLTVVGNSLPELRDLVNEALDDVADEAGDVIESIDWHFADEVMITTPGYVMRDSAPSDEAPVNRIQQVQRPVLAPA